MGDLERPDPGYTDRSLMSLRGIRLFPFRFSELQRILRLLAAVSFKFAVYSSPSTVRSREGRVVRATSPGVVFHRLSFEGVPS